MDTFILTAPRWDQPDPEHPGSYLSHREGDVLHLPADEAARLLKAGAIRRADGTVGVETAADVAEAAVSVADVVEEAEEPAGESVPRPRQAAAKAVWIDYAVSQGLDRAEAEAMDKRELIAALS